MRTRSRPHPGESPSESDDFPYRSAPMRANVLSGMAPGPSSSKAMSARRPSTPAELLAVPGIGPAKLERYGAAFLEEIARG
jgi:superfamily II DNA helicase RecQ